MKHLSLVIVLLAALPAPLRSQDGGEVRVPLNVYTDLVNRATTEAVHAPAGYALGKASVQVSARNEAGRVTATVTASMSLKVLESRWTLVPIDRHAL